jgi:DNA-binding transcriptional MerR regulator
MVMPVEQEQITQDRLLKIGELAELTGLAVGTIRYYETLDLLHPSQRGENGYRLYDHSAIQRLNFIRKAQTLQFTLSDIQQVLGVRQQGNTVCPMVQDLLDHKITYLTEQIDRMQSLKYDLETYRDQWHDRPFDDPRSQELCSLIEGVVYRDVSTKL